MIEMAFIASAQKSIEMISVALAGNGYFRPSILIAVDVEIDDRRQLQLVPSIEEINNLFGNIHRSILEAFSQIPRLNRRLRAKSIESISDYHEIIAEDNEFREKQRLIERLLIENQQKLKAYVEMWTPFVTFLQHKCTELDHEPMAVVDIEQNVHKMSEMSTQLALKDIREIISFVSVDAQQLRRQILIEIREWQRCHWQIAVHATLEKMLRFFSEIDKENDIHVSEVSIQNDEELHRYNQFYDRLKTEIDKWRCTVDEVNFSFDIFSRHDVSIDDTLEAMKVKLNRRWNDRLKSFDRTREMLDGATREK